MHYIFTVGKDWKQIQFSENAQDVLYCLAARVGGGAIDSFNKEFGSIAIKGKYELGDYYSKLNAGFSLFVCIDEDDELDLNAFHESLTLFVNEYDELVQNVKMMIIVPDSPKYRLSEIKDILNITENGKMDLNVSGINRLEVNLGIIKETH